ncbi:hypothetical protein NHG32_08275 [Aerococcaceae bacterium NML191219]|nr:hypothetical protein [Aerococcaceae bacterium NML191219]
MSKHILLRNVSESLDNSIRELQKSKKHASKSETIQWILEQFFHHQHYYFVRGELTEVSEILAQAIERNTTVLELIRDEVK